MKKYTSDKIANLSWFCSILVVFIHAGTYAFNLPGAQTATIYGKNVSTFVQMFFCEGICRIAVPLFFLFSGYLFFQNFEFTGSCILTKFKRRVFSLLIPYLFWSLGTFLFFYIAQSIPAKLPQIKLSASLQRVGIRHIKHIFESRIFRRIINEGNTLCPSVDPTTHFVVPKLQRRTSPSFKHGIVTHKNKAQSLSASSPTGKAHISSVVMVG